MMQPLSETEIRNPKLEIRNKFKIRKVKTSRAEITENTEIKPSVISVPSVAPAFSDFVFRISNCPPLITGSVDKNKHHKPLLTFDLRPRHPLIKPLISGAVDETREKKVKANLGGAWLPPSFGTAGHRLKLMYATNDSGRACGQHHRCPKVWTPGQRMNRLIGGRGCPATPPKGRITLAGGVANDSHQRPMHRRAGVQK
jgi:hypothetical protein